MRAIDDYVGPAELFTVADQEQMFNLEQAFYLHDDEEETGIDFSGFYYLMRCIYAVKQYGKTAYGSLTPEEWDLMITTHEFFKGALKYMNNSHVMVGNYKNEPVYSSESESYMYSSG